MNAPTTGATHSAAVRGRGVMRYFFTFKFQFQKMDKLKSKDIAHFLAAGIKLKFRRGGDEFVGELAGCNESSIVIKNAKGRYASRSEYYVFDEESFWPILRHMDDMTLDEVNESDAFDKMSGSIREAYRTKWYFEKGIDCFGWIGKGLAIRAKYYHLKEGEIIQDGDEVEMSNTIHDPAKWVPAAGSTIGTPAPDPSYPAHRKYRRLIFA